MKLIWSAWIQMKFRCDNRSFNRNLSNELILDVQQMEFNLMLLCLDANSGWNVFLKIIHLPSERCQNGKKEVFTHKWTIKMQYDKHFFIIILKKCESILYYLKFSLQVFYKELSPVFNMYVQRAQLLAFASRCLELYIILLINNVFLLNVISYGLY